MRNLLKPAHVSGKKKQGGGGMAILEATKAEANQSRFGFEGHTKQLPPPMFLYIRSPAVRKRTRACFPIMLV